MDMIKINDCKELDLFDHFIALEFLQNNLEDITFLCQLNNN